MYTENSTHVHRVHTNNIVSVCCMNTGVSGSVLRKHTRNSTSVICAHTTNIASLQYVNSSHITMSGKRGLTLLWYHEKVTLTVPWGQYDPIVKNPEYKHSLLQCSFLPIIFHNTGLYSNIDK